MPLSWNEIRSRAIEFANEFSSATREHAEAKSFWDAFFNIFGISRRRVATFEKRVKKLGDKEGYVDLFWKGVILVEHKSKGKNLDKAYHQAKDYFAGLKEHELPKYILVSDFEWFRLFNLEADKQHEFTLKTLFQHIHLFDFIAGYKQKSYENEAPVNTKAAERMGKLHDRLKAVGYDRHALEVYLVRLLFCLFAEDTGIFEKNLFHEYIDTQTKTDGSDLAMHLAHIFQVLNTPPNQRLTNLDDSLKVFPYVNGQLFAEYLPLAAFDSQMRQQLLKACALDWSQISPAIFGSMFQAAMDAKTRRNLGAHYTSEKNIQKLIRPLFLDELYEEFEKVKISLPKLQAFQEKLAKLKFLDPACGSGNFLIVTYRELRLLEIKVLKEIFFVKQKYRKEVLADAGIKINLFVKINVDQFYGIEIDEFAAKIAEVGMWLIDHQMNQQVSQIFGQYFVRLPLKKSATIRHGNALRIDWESVVDKKELNYILGNPPFYGSKMQSKEQRSDLAAVFGAVKNAKIMDYVAAWYIQAAKYIQNTSIKAAFVSTNSITQGEQVGVLWNEMLNNYGIKIHFAHRTFKWTNKAKGKAAVYVIIIGFANFDIKDKILHDYENIKGEPTATKAKNINPYLVDASDLTIISRTNPITNIPKMKFGNMPLDGGHLLLSDEEKIQLLKHNPKLKKYIKPFISAREFLNGKKRWCFWLLGVSPKELRSFDEIMKRVQAVKAFRLASKAPSTQKHAATPALFRDKNNPETFIVVPLHSSERRNYIPLGIFDKKYIANNSTSIIPNGSIVHFGILSSKMHMVWVKYICGRIKNDYRYSKNIVYNNYPFPKDPSEKKRKKVEKAAQKVLAVRAEFPESSLADLYDPLTMPPKLVKAHQALDKAVDLCYRPQPFANERKRIAFLFELYEEYVAPLMVMEKSKKRGRKR